MKHRFLALTLLTLPIACGPAAPPVAPAPPPPPVATAAPAAPEPKPAELTPEEKKKAEDARRLAEDRAAMEAEMKVETERWTPELHAEAKALADAKYATLDAGVKAALKGKHRNPKNPERDAFRHPLETLKFFGMKPTMTVLEYGPGEGWYTEILAPTLAAKGKLLVTNTDPKGPADARSTFYGERLLRFLALSPEAYGKVETIVIDSKSPAFGLEGKVDMVLAIRTIHGMYRDKLLTGFLGEVHKALKPGGVLGVVQHRAKADANPDDSAKKGYLPEALVVKEVEAAGFKLSGRSEINANPNDTTDHEEGVWALPPTLRNKEKDRAKYVAIGESDRMTLRFVKK